MIHVIPDEHPRQHSMNICVAVPTYGVLVVKEINKKYHKRQSQKSSVPGK